MEKYFDPEMEIIEFETEDIITTSGGGTLHDPDEWLGWEEEDEEPWEIVDDEATDEVLEEIDNNVNEDYIK